MVHYDATDVFVEALTEVDFLLRSAAANERDTTAYNALNKAAILLLTAKLEAFSEQILEEFCFCINGKHLPSERIPPRIRLNATKTVLNDEFLNCLERCDENRIIPSLEAIARLWHVGATPSTVALDYRFNYGRHGEKEFRRLFQRIGIENIFESCKIVDEDETYNPADTQQFVTVASDVNALIGYRNYIIHNDGTPTITHKQLERYRRRIFLFVQSIDLFVHRHDTAII